MNNLKFFIKKCTRVIQKRQFNPKKWSVDINPYVISQICHRFDEFVLWRAHLLVNAEFDLELLGMVERH